MKAEKLNGGQRRGQKIPGKAVCFIFHHVVQGFLNPKTLQYFRTQLIMMLMEYMAQFMGEGKTYSFLRGCQLVIHNDIATAV